ncbi:MAG: hypothetical protein A7315_14490 [Candidatus Altiarchaeales archaeon WOR_SM1_79]|nr:MAG: hypothetical protein A7315_14490 [Candidatus Altiarchaeales archaeon WOR_SM1_79]
MILIDVNLWNEVKKEYELFEALVDTGSSYCVIEKSIADALGLDANGILHLWQMGEPLNVPLTGLRCRYRKKEYAVDGLIVEIRGSYKRPMLSEEECECTRPESPHPLTNRVIIGKTFLDKLSKEEYTKLFER